jgi:hypothetical protein
MNRSDYHDKSVVQIRIHIQLELGSGEEVKRTKMEGETKPKDT